MPKKILLVDDEPDILKVIGFRLEKAGYQVVLASNGKDGVDMAQRESPDVVLLDVMMDGMDGFEVCKRLKQANSAQKIVIYTAKVDGVNAAKARESGADDFTVKTADLKYILEVIDRLI